MHIFLITEYILYVNMVHACANIFTQKQYHILHLLYIMKDFTEYKN